MFRSSLLRSIIRPLSVLALGAALLASPPTAQGEEDPAVFGRCNEWLPLSNCEENAIFICNLWCPSWIIAICSGDNLMCVSEPQ